MQGKGIRATTMTADQIAEATEVSVSRLPLDDVRYWYASADPVYLVVYLEATEEFLAADIRTLVDEQRGGAPGLAELADVGQDTLTLTVPVDATLARALEVMPTHRTIRADGPAFRGRPLGHRFDPMRSQLAVMPPDLFQRLVDGLLTAHDFRTETVTTLIAGDHGAVVATVGRLGSTFEWTVPLFTEYGFDERSDWRHESSPFYAHGEVLVVTQSDPAATPAAVATNAGSGGVDSSGWAGLLRDLRPPDAPALVMANAPDHVCFGGWRAALDDLSLFPLGLGSLAFSLLTTTNVYLELVDQLRWDHVNYL
ncbi:MAG: hypothetical protein ACRDWY_04995 [Actinomycetes bacterium]